jgi:FtsP/CotA-like multicopper oxidase with cupredoxin domain
MRANVGDCIRMIMVNQLDRPTSFHVHGADLIIQGTGVPALATNPDATALPGEQVSYEWYVTPEHYEENTHYAHPHGPNARFQVGHGLFAAVLIESEGAEYLDQRTGDPLCEKSSDGQTERCRAAWQAIISPQDGSDFREFAMFYHEIGNEDFNVLDANNVELEVIDPITGSYKTSGRAINYRSEPFAVRLAEAESKVEFYREWQGDESLTYSSYSFGDPATPIPQSYLGDPVKFRLLHAGSEIFHVPHLHGGGVQWQRQHDMGKDSADDYVPINAGLTKQFASSMPSSGNDAQTIMPSETYEIEIGCGAGGCQQSVGDFLFHCHIASHYISGMWHFWRVYNTLQDGNGKTDDLSVVAQLPDRMGSVEPAVSSDQLIGRSVEFSGRQFDIDDANLAEIVEVQLPPQGKSRDEQDAQVFDWVRDGNLYLNEPESELAWPNFRSSAPGSRIALNFVPETGKLAWPFLRPHLGKRPPFAPQHGPSPYLEPFGHDEGGGAPVPGANGESSLCPTNAPRRFYKIHAIQTPLRIFEDVEERDGMLFVLEENEGLARTIDSEKVPLAIRANQGDCVDIVLVNELDGLRDEIRPDIPELNKTNIHVHFVQFDVQASDGVATGAAFEQSPRPIQQDGVTAGLTDAVAAGATSLTVSDPGLFHPGAAIAIGIDQPQEVFETATIESIDGNRLHLARPLQNNHRFSEGVTTEFVRYRWYVARQNGAIYFHDHADALLRWGRGLFGAIIAEPRDSTHHDPITGEEIRSGPVADIRTDRQVVPGLTGSFREFVLFLTDRNPETFRAYNMRAETLIPGTDRNGGPKEELFSSVRHGDPRTPVFEVEAGDPIMLRLLTTATEEIHPFTITGHRFRQERFQEASPLLSTVTIGVSERFNAYIEAAGGPMHLPGDYLFYNSTERHFLRGAWGMLRVHPSGGSGLQPLPGHEPRVPQSASGEFGPCPTSAPIRPYSVGVTTLPTTVDFGGGPHLESVRRYYLESPGDGARPFNPGDPPMVIRANAGDCLEITFSNRSIGNAGFHIEGAYTDPKNGYGASVGFNGELHTPPGESAVYRYYLPGEIGVMRIRDFSNPFRNGELGLYGALIVEPAGSTWHDPVTDEPLHSGIEAVIRKSDGTYFREFATLFQEQDSVIGRFLMPYREDIEGDISVNYRAAPFGPRFDDLNRRDPRRFANLFNDSQAGPPATQVFTAIAGEEVRFRVVSAYSEQPQVFSVESHDWLLTPNLPGSDRVSSRVLAPGAVLNVEIASAGGPAGRPGDYLWLNHRMPYFEGGHWGLLRVLPADTDMSRLPVRPGEEVTRSR